LYAVVAAVPIPPKVEKPKVGKGSPSNPGRKKNKKKRKTKGVREPISTSLMYSILPLLFVM